MKRTASRELNQVRARASRAAARPVFHRAVSVASVASAATHTPSQMKQKKGTPQKDGVLRVRERLDALGYRLELRGGQPEALPQFLSNVSGVGDVRRICCQNGRRRGS